MYVIYSEEETRENPDLGPAFWSDPEGGWTNFMGATIYIGEKPMTALGCVISLNAGKALYNLFHILLEAEFVE